MQKVIYKYQLSLTDRQIVQLPMDAKILTIQNQNNNVCLWALINPDEKNLEDRVIEMFGTGHLLSSESILKGKYVSTIQLFDRELVFHVFEILT